MSLDDKARDWLAQHPSPDAMVIAYQDTRCCGGGHIRDLQLRGSRRKDRDSGQLIGIGEVAGRRIYLDRRIVARMPHMIPITVGGIGPFRGLHLAFSGDEWGRLLYE